MESELGVARAMGTCPRHDISKFQLLCQSNSKSVYHNKFVLPFIIWPRYLHSYAIHRTCPFRAREPINSVTCLPAAVAVPYDWLLIASKIHFRFLQSSQCCLETNNSLLSHDKSSLSDPFVGDCIPDCPSVRLPLIHSIVTLVVVACFQDLSTCFNRKFHGSSIS